jgi:hypothetical protein
MLEFLNMNNPELHFKMFNECVMHLLRHLVQLFQKLLLYKEINWIWWIF